jgi:hypothetical protein
VLSLYFDMYFIFLINKKEQHDIICYSFNFFKMSNIYIKMCRFSTPKSSLLKPSKV